MDLPILVGSIFPDDAPLFEAFAKEIASLLRQDEGEIILIGSTDLSHCYTEEVAIQTDSVAIQHILDLDVELSS